MNWNERGATIQPSILNKRHVSMCMFTRCLLLYSADMSAKESLAMNLLRAYLRAARDTVVKVEKVFGSVCKSKPSATYKYCFVMYHCRTRRVLRSSYNCQLQFNQIIYTSPLNFNHKDYLNDYINKGSTIRPSDLPLFLYTAIMDQKKVLNKLKKHVFPKC